MVDTVQTVDATSQRTRTWAEEADMVMSLLNCVVLDRESVYASSEFTTGKRFYDLCREYGVRSDEELKRKMGPSYYEKLLGVNKNQGINFARKLRGLGHFLVVTPNPFVADPLKLKHNWTQDEYLTFWKMVITEKCSAVFFNEGWQYSNGCTFEYVVGLKAELPLFDHNGASLDTTRAITLLKAAIQDLEGDGFSVPKLRDVLDQLNHVSH